MKIVILFIIALLSFSYSEKCEFNILMPPLQQWTSAFIIQNKDSVKRQMLSDTAYLGWLNYTWNCDSLPDSMLVYSESDSTPIGINGFWSTSQNPFPIKDMFSNYKKSVYFLSYGECDSNIYGDCIFDDVRSQYYYEKNELKSSLNKTIFVLVPDYKEWINETPVIISTSSNVWEMQSDKDYAGWFKFTWKRGDVLPENFLIYKKSDTLRTEPIGANGFALGNTNLVPISFDNRDSIFLIPDLNYFYNEDTLAMCCNSFNIKYYSDARQVKVLEYNSLKDDFKPRYYYQGILNNKVISFSLYNESGDTLLFDTHEPDIYKNCLDLQNFATIKLLNKPCDLAPGKYYLEFSIDSSKSIMNFTVDSLLIPLKILQHVALKNNVNIELIKNIVHISSNESTSYVILNSIGQIVSKGRFNKTKNITLFNQGLYIIKVGEVVRKVHFFNNK